MHKLFAVLTILACLPLPAHAQTGTPEAVQAVIDEAQKQCESTSGKFNFNPGALKSADLNGDGYPDYVLSMAGIGCEGITPPAAGSDQPHHIFLSAGDKILKQDRTATINAFTFNIDESANPPQIIYRRHCKDGKGADEYESRWNWTGTAMAEVASTAVMCPP